MDKDLKKKNEELIAALEDMCYQFAGWSNGGYTTSGLSCLAYAFHLLGWASPHVVKSMQCDEGGCNKQANCGWKDKVSGNYRRTCGKHANF